MTTPKDLSPEEIDAIGREDEGAWSNEHRFRVGVVVSKEELLTLCRMARRATPEAIRAKLSDDAFLDRLCIALECSGTPDPVELIAARLTSED